jgi:hypothetical protein
VENFEGHSPALLALGLCRYYQRGWEGFPMRSFLTVIASAVVLAGCAGQTTKGSVDLAHEQATLAQCKGEGARGGDPGDYGHKERSITIACMARNGYIIQTQ